MTSLCYWISGLCFGISLGAFCMESYGSSLILMIACGLNLYAAGME